MTVLHFCRLLHTWVFVVIVCCRWSIKLRIKSTVALRIWRMSVLTFDRWFQWISKSARFITSKQSLTCFIPPQTTPFINRKLLHSTNFVTYNTWRIFWNENHLPQKKIFKQNTTNECNKSSVDVWSFAARPEHKLNGNEISLLAFRLVYQSRIVHIERSWTRATAKLSVRCGLRSSNEHDTSR